MKDFIKWMDLYPKRLILGTLLMILALLVGCAVDVRERDEYPFVFEDTSTPPLVQYITNRENKEDGFYIAHVRKILNYVKIPFQQINIQNFNKGPFIAPTARVVIVFDTRPLKPEAMEALVGFVANGGSVILLKVTEDLNFGFLAGLKKNPVFAFNEQAYGFRFLTSFVPGMKGRSYNNKTLHYGLQRENFSERVTVLATAINDPSYPVLLEHRIKKGRVLIFNTTEPSQKIDRGLYFSAILMALPQVPYPVVNSGVLFLDDFPSPVYNVKEEPISSEFNLTMASFYTDVWWPDMAELAKKEQLTYTAMACFDYQNKTTPPFVMTEWENTKKIINGKQQVISDWLMHQVEAYGHELALHGYNHVSLVGSEWQRPEYMETALTAAYKKWKATQYGSLPVTYVPPSNRIDSLGLIALEVAVPSVTYVCSTYEGIKSEGGDREFDPDPYNQFFFSFPRITTGYYFDDNEHFRAQATFLYTGIWSHFIHPDDVFQIKGAETEATRGDFGYRNPDNLKWRSTRDGSRGMLPRFKDYIKELKATYPLLRFVAAKSGAQLTRQWRYQRFLHSETDKKYTVQAQGNPQPSPTFWMVYIPARNWAKCEAQWKGSNVSYSKTPLHDGYLVMVKSNNGTLSVPRATTDFNPNNASAIGLMAIEDFRKYTDGDIEFESLDEEMEWLVSEGRTAEAIDILKLKIENNDYSPVPNELGKLVRYLQLDDREFEIWPILEKVYQHSEASHFALIDLSLRLVENSDYPNLTIRKTWMDRQLSRYPNNGSLWDDYTAYFSGEIQNLGPEKMLQLMKNTHIREHKTQYAFLLAETAPEKFLEFMENQVPCEDLSLVPLSATITWLYADRQQYKKAIAWAACSTAIPTSDLLQWYLLTGDLEYVKKNNYAKYMEYVLLIKPDLALKELMEYQACGNILKPLSTQISYAFANKGLYRKALAWASCSEKITMSEQLYWYSQLNDFPEMERVYQEYMKTHPFDDDTKYFMAQIYAQMGKITESWQIAATLPFDARYKDLRNLLNKEVLYIGRSKQRALINGFPDYFFPETYQKLQRENRLYAGPTLRYANEIISDKLRPTAVDNGVLYGFLGRGNLKHEIGITHYTAWALEAETINSTNALQRLLGAIYSIESSERFEKLNYRASARFERNEGNKYFYRLSARISKSKDSTYASLGASHKPAVTGPSYLMNIYNTRLEAYYENHRFLKNYRLALSLETNYYTNSAVNAQFTTTAARRYLLSKSSSWTVYSEVSGMRGNTDQRNGFPFWTIKERLYGGVGLDFSYKNSDNNLKFSLGAAGFADTFSGLFQRFRGSISCPIAPYLYGTAAAEFYTLKNFYSNNFNFGLQYRFRAP